MALADEVAKAEAFLDAELTRKVARRAAALALAGSADAQALYDRTKALRGPRSSGGPHSPEVEAGGP